MTELMFPGKRPRAPSFADMHPEYSENHAAAAAATEAFGLSPEKANGQSQVKNFLEVCSFCKKNLRRDEDIFMYGYFGAFCTEICRTKQMTIDFFKEKAIALKKGRICDGKTTTNPPTKELKEEEALRNGESNVATSPPKFFI